MRILWQNLGLAGADLLIHQFLLRRRDLSFCYLRAWCNPSGQANSSGAPVLRCPPVTLMAPREQARLHEGICEVPLGSVQHKLEGFRCISGHGGLSFPSHLSELPPQPHVLSCHEKMFQVASTCIRSSSFPCRCICQPPWLVAGSQRGFASERISRAARYQSNQQCSRQHQVHSLRASTRLLCIPSLPT